MLFKESFKEETLLCCSSLGAGVHNDPSLILISSPDRREDEPKPINNWTIISSGVFGEQHLNRPTCTKYAIIVRFICQETILQSFLCTAVKEKVKSKKEQTDGFAIFKQ